MNKSLTNNVVIKNKKASFEFAFLETYIAGIVLTGTEIKSIRGSKANISEAYCFFEENELFIKNFNISPYDLGTHYNHEPLRVRKLLLKKRELKKLSEKLKDVGLTIIPVKLFFSESGLAKLEIALAKGKKLYDKRESIKARDTERNENRKF